MTTTIYTLELENNKYYVGKSCVPKQRILKHFQEEGNEWTKLYNPISVVELISNGTTTGFYSLCPTPTPTVTPSSI